MSERHDNLPGEWMAIPDPLASQTARDRSSPPRPSTPALTRRQVTARRTLLPFAALLWGLLVVVAVRFREMLPEHVGAIAVQCSLWITLAAGTSYAAAARGRRGLGAPAWIAAVVAAAAPLVFVVLAFVWIPGGAGPNGVGSIRSLAACSSIGLLTALPQLLLATWALRRSFVTAATRRGAAIGAACGLLGASVLTLHCGITVSGHVALAHGLPIVVAALLGGWIVARAGRVA